MTNLILDNKGQAIQVGSIVRYQTGWVRITRLNSKWCNLGAIWGGIVYKKKVPLNEIFADEAAWYERWTQSDQYRQM
jgi:hypothetical protein